MIEKSHSDLVEQKRHDFDLQQDADLTKMISDAKAHHKSEFYTPNIIEHRSQRKYMSPLKRSSDSNTGLFGIQYDCKCKGFCEHLMRGDPRIKSRRMLLNISKQVMGGDIAL